MIERAFACFLILALFCGVLAMCGLIAKAKCFSHINRNVLIRRAAERWRAIGP